MIFQSVESRPLSGFRENSGIVLANEVCIPAEDCQETSFPAERPIELLTHWTSYCQAMLANINTREKPSVVGLYCPGFCVSLYGYKSSSIFIMKNLCLTFTCLNLFSLKKDPCKAGLKL